MSLVELLASIAVIGISMMIMLRQISLSHRQEARDRDVGFAYAKAMSLLAELQVSVDQSDIPDMEALDGLASTVPDPVLTMRTGTAVLSPDHPMSGNVLLRTGTWKWGRTIDVEEIPSLSSTRYVRIKVHRCDTDGTAYVDASVGAMISLPTTAHPSVKEYDVYLIAIASAPSLWMTLPSLRATMQTAAEGIEANNPGLKFRLHWITKLGYGRDPLYTPFINEQNTADAAAPYAYMYPGRLASGDGVSSLYSSALFSGRIRDESGVRNGYEATDNPHPHSVADRFNHCMREPAARELFAKRVLAGTEKADEPPLQLLLEDLYRDPSKMRNAMIVNLHGSGLPFPPLRNYSDPAKVPDRYPGVRVVTHPARLHSPRGSGAGDTFAALEDAIDTLIADNVGMGFVADLERCKSDIQAAAKMWQDAKPSGAVDSLDKATDHIDDATDNGLAPSVAALLRVRLGSLKTRITLGTYGETDEAGVELRVYAYKTDPDAGAPLLKGPITVQIMGVDLTARVNASSPTLEVDRYTGGINITMGTTTGDTVDYERPGETTRVPRIGAPREAYEMHYDVGYVAGPDAHTWIRLYNTPLTTPRRLNVTGDGEGLHEADRLYGLEYIPSPMRADAPFASDIDLDGDVAKNTARWRIRVPNSALSTCFGNVDARITMHTKIGTCTNVGHAAPGEPYNLSTTYTWWAASPEAVPLTERYQLQGDPRHNPYVDLLEGGSFAHGYNCFFDDLQNGGTDVRGQWKCLDPARLKDGFVAGNIVDVPRSIQIWRQALQQSNAVFSDPQGYVAGALLLGGEIALPGSGQTPATVTVHGSLYGSASSVGVDDVIATTNVANSSLRLGRPVIREPSAGFWAKPWLGELFPDSAYASYAANGNLPTTEFRRERRRDATLASLPAGTTFSYESGSSLADTGLATLMQVGTTGSRHRQTAQPAGSEFNLTVVGSDILQAAAVRLTQPIAGLLPFERGASLSSTLAHGSWLAQYPSQSERPVVTLAEKTSALAGINVFQVAPGGSLSKSGFFVLSGETPTHPDGHRELASRALLFSLGGFHAAGVTTWGQTIAQLPRIEIRKPAPQKTFTNPTSIELSWDVDWVRFDGNAYSSLYPASFRGAEADLRYVVLISTDDGATWRAPSTNDVVEPGKLPPDPGLVLSDSSPGMETYLMSTPAETFPQGTVLVRVDCLQHGRSQHACHHVVEIDVRR